MNINNRGVGAPAARDPQEASLMRETAQKLREAADSRRREGDDRGARADENLADRFERRARGENV